MQTPDKDRLDLWLDEALRQHGQAEPREGIERRLLVTLQSREERTRAIRKWTPIFGSPVLALLLIALVWRGERASINPPALNSGNRISRPSGAEQVLGKVSPSGTRNIQVARTNQHRPSSRTRPNEPRLAHFPSVRPPSPEEIVLARYAANYPQEAALVAKEQQNFDEEVQKAQQEIEVRSGTSNE